MSASPAPMVPDALYRAIKLALGDNFSADLAHPVDTEGAVAFVLVTPDSTTYLVQFEPPASTTISHLARRTLRPA